MSLLIPYRKKSKWGYSDISGNIVVNCVYDQVQELALENELLLVKQNGENILINRSGNRVVRDFETYRLCEKAGELLVLARKVVHTKQIEKGTVEYDMFPKEPGAYYPDLLEISTYEYGVYDSKGRLVASSGNQSYEEVMQLLSCNDMPVPVYSAEDSNMLLRPVNLPDPESESGYKGFYFDLSGQRDSRFEYAFTLAFVNGIAPVQTAKDQWIYINEENVQVSRRSYLRALPFQQYGIAKVATSFENCSHTDPGNQQNWTSIPDNLWIPEGANVGFIDRQGNEYWED